MPERASPPARAFALVLAVLFLTVALAGCYHETEEETGARVGDFVRVHYVARLQSNGSVVSSSLDGPWPEGAELDDVPAEDHMPGQFWVYLWHDAVKQNRTGREIVQRVAFEDLDADDFRESMFQVREDVLRDEQGTTSRENRKVVLFDVPEAVIGDPNLVMQGFFELLLGVQENQTLDDVEVPPAKAFGVYDPTKVAEVSRVSEVQDRDVEDRNRSGIERESNMTDETREGDVIRVNLTEDTQVDAEVTHLNRTHVSIYLLLEEGLNVPFRGIWDRTVVNVTEDHYQLRHEPEEGRRYTLGDTNFEVTRVTDEQMTLDSNHPFAGETLVYDVRVLNVVRPDEEAIRRGAAGDPHGDDAELTDVGFLGRSGLLVSSDKGVHLSINSQEFNLRLGNQWFEYAKPLAGQRVTAMLVAADGHGEVWAAAEGSGLMFTSDSGRTWQAIGEGLPDGATVAALAKAPTDPDVLYALVEDAGVFRSDDRGETFDLVSDALTRAGALAVGADDADVLWAATASGLRRSTDGGATWAVADFSGRTVQDIAIVNATTRYAVVDGRFHNTTDDGANWNASTTADTGFIRAAQSPGNPSVYVAIVPDGVVWFSPDAGRQFVPLRSRGG